MANLQIKGIKDEFYTRLKALAEEENRSVSQQVLFVLKDYFARKKTIQNTKTPAQVLLELHGSWIDTEDADQIVEKIKNSRSNSKKLSDGF